MGSRSAPFQVGRERLADHLHSELVVSALQMAQTQRRPGPGLLVHSDRGVQYASRERRAYLEAHGWQASMSRERRDFYLFIDEFQNFSTDAFASILAEARKYRLCLTLSHQYIDQVPLPIRQAVFGNVGTLISFRVGHTHAEALHQEFGSSHIAQQVVDLDKFEVLARLLEDGVNREPFRAKTLAPV